MKTTLTKQMIGLCIITASLAASCTSPKEKVDDAEKNVTEAQLELDKAKQDYKDDMKRYKEEIGAKIAENEVTISNLNAQADKVKNKEEYQAKVAKLEQRNAELKIKLENYDAQDKTQWEQFKSEFSHDITELGKAFNDMSTNNVK